MGYLTLRHLTAAAFHLTGRFQKALRLELAMAVTLAHFHLSSPTLMAASSTPVARHQPRACRVRTGWPMKVALCRTCQPRLHGSLLSRSSSAAGKVRGLYSETFCEAAARDCSTGLAARVISSL